MSKQIESQGRSVLSFEEFYAKTQEKMDFNQPCHPDWYMIGASSSQYPKSDPSLESPIQLYERLYPVATYGSKKISMEIMEESEDIDKMIEHEESQEQPQLPQAGLSKYGYLFKPSRIWDKAREDKITKTNNILARVELASSLRPKNLNNQNVLVLPSVGLTRSLSIIQCLIELEAKLGKKVHEQYDLIAGTGDSAIIAICCALGMDLNETKRFFVNDWAKAYEVSFFGSLVRRLDNINPMSKPKYGFFVKKAKSILCQLLKDSKDESMQRKFYDLKTEVYLPAIFSKYKESVAYTKVTSENLPLVDALMDVCLDPFHFDVTQTIKDKGIPLPIKDIELRIMQENRNVIITKIDVPYLHMDHGNLDHATAKELAPAIRDLGDFMNKINTEAHASNFNVKRIKYECNKIPEHIHKNSTKITALNAAIEAGKAIKPDLEG